MHTFAQCCLSARTLADHSALITSTERTEREMKPVLPVPSACMPASPHTYPPLSNRFLPPLLPALPRLLPLLACTLLTAPLSPLPSKSPVRSLRPLHRTAINPTPSP
eukprot:1253488-Rhodomonas_salina.2